MLSPAGHSPPLGSRATRAFWGVTIAAAPPVALLAAHSGLGWPHAEWGSDLAWLVLVSVFEEFVFRGVIQPSLARRYGAGIGAGATPWISRANLLTSALFAAMHLWRHPALLALAVFPVSLVFGKARELSGRWWPAALLHAWFNGSLYAASWWLAATR